MTQAVPAAKSLRPPARRRSSGTRVKAASLQIPPLPKRPSTADLMVQVRALHDCVHQTQEHTKAGFEAVTSKMEAGFGEVHDRITEVATEVAYVKGLQEGQSRALGMPTKAAEGDADSKKAKAPFALLSAPKAGLIALAGSLGTVGILKVGAAVWPQFWAFCVALFQALIASGS